MGPSEEYRKALENTLLYLKHNNQLSDADVLGILKMTDDYISNIKVVSYVKLVEIENAIKKAKELQI